MLAIETVLVNLHKFRRAWQPGQANLVRQIATAKIVAHIAMPIDVGLYILQPDTGHQVIELQSSGSASSSLARLPKA
jgi:hypothetical protein